MRCRRTVCFGPVPYVQGERPIDYETAAHTFMEAILKLSPEEISRLGTYTVSRGDQVDLGDNSHLQIVFNTNIARDFVFSKVGRLKADEKYRVFEKFPESWWPQRRILEADAKAIRDHRMKVDGVDTQQYKARVRQDHRSKVGMTIFVQKTAPNSAWMPLHFALKVDGPHNFPVKLPSQE